MKKEIILADFNQTYSDFENAISLFDEATFNQVPFEGSWTPAQVTQHILLSITGFANVLAGEVKDTDRPIDELIPKLKGIFLDFSTKLNSPDFIKPELKEYDQNRHLTKVKSLREAIAKEINDLDLSKTCLSFQMPTMGYLTRLEAIYFVIYHTQRHTHQLREIHRFQKKS